MDSWSRTDLLFEKTSPLVRQFLFFKIVPCHDNTQFPAFAVFGLKTRACMMAKRFAAFENKELMKISIKFDKFTGLFDK